MRNIVVTLERRVAAIATTTTPIVARQKCVVGTSNTTMGSRGVGRVGGWVVTVPRGRATKRSGRHHGFGRGKRKDGRKKASVMSLSERRVLFRYFSACLPGLEAKVRVGRTQPQLGCRAANNQEREGDLGSVWRRGRVEDCSGGGSRERLTVTGCGSWLTRMGIVMMECSFWG